RAQATGAAGPLEYQGDGRRPGDAKRGEDLALARPPLHAGDASRNERAGTGAARVPGRKVAPRSLTGPRPVSEGRITWGNRSRRPVRMLTIRLGVSFPRGSRS